MPTKPAPDDDEANTPGNVERRRHTRYEVSYNIAECVLTHSESAAKFVGLVCNYSKSGICIITYQALSAGQKIAIKCKKPQLSNPTTAIVRWAKNDSSCSCKAGLEFA